AGQQHPGAENKESKSFHKDSLKFGEIIIRDPDRTFESGLGPNLFPPIRLVRRCSIQRRRKECMKRLRSFVKVDARLQTPCLCAISVPPVVNVFCGNFTTETQRFFTEAQRDPFSERLSQRVEG